jgi:hypothetical protein
MFSFVWAVPQVSILGTLRGPDEESFFDSQQRQQSFHFSKASILALELTQPI